MQFEPLREGLDDYRRLITLERLSRELAGAAAGKAGAKLLAELLGTFQLRRS